MNAMILVMFCYFWSMLKTAAMVVYRYCSNRALFPASHLLIDALFHFIQFRSAFKTCCFLTKDQPLLINSRSFHLTTVQLYSCKYSRPTDNFKVFNQGPNAIQLFWPNGKYIPNSMSFEAYLGVQLGEEAYNVGFL